MKLVSFIHQGEPTYGVRHGDGIVDLKKIYPQAPDLKSFLALHVDPASVGQQLHGQPVIAQEQVTLLPVIPNPNKIICIGLNYHAHVEECARTVTEKPTLFLRVPESQLAHLDDMPLPPESTHLDFEGEIAIVIGTPGRRITPQDSWKHIAGYSCYNDGSVRDWQAATTQWTAGKNFWKTGGFGPHLVTRDEIADGQVMTLVTRLNGVEVQRTTTDLLIHTIPNIIAHVSTIMPLAVGDVIVTGTPGGIGAKRNPPLWMKEGDLVEVESDAIGVLSNRIRRE